MTDNIMLLISIFIIFVLFILLACLGRQPLVFNCQRSQLTSSNIAGLGRQSSNYNIAGGTTHDTRGSRPKGDIVVDTLNLAGYLFNKAPSEKEIIHTLRYATPILKSHFPGRIMFVLKDKNSTYNSDTERDIFKQLAHELKIYIYIVEKYEDNSPTWKLEKKYDTQTHSLHARDDLFTIILSKQYRCPILTNDTFSDIQEFKDTVAPFKVLIYDYFTADYKQPTRESIMPTNLTLSKRLAIKKIYSYFKEGELK